MGLALVHEQEEPRRLFTPEQPAEPKAAAPKPSPTAPQVMAVFQAISAILAVRAILVLAGAGAFALFAIAALRPGWASGCAAVFYAVTVMLPLVLLSWKKG